MPKHIEEIVNQQLLKSAMAQQRAAEVGIGDSLPVLTISRRMGSGARIVANKLAQQLGWSLWDKELLDAIACDARVSKRVVEAFDEKTISEIELLAKGALGDHEMSGFLYHLHLARTVAAIGQLGNAIILGRGANYILPDALSVRIDAPDNQRIENMISYEDLTKQEAERKIHASDKERRDFLTHTFGKGRVDKTTYDLSIWMKCFRPDDAVEIIKIAMGRRFGMLIPRKP
jgi:cytidylate kinase